MNAIEIRSATTHDFDTILDVINDGASAYRGVIPDDCWHEPYMSRDDLTDEVRAEVKFSLLETGNQIAAVMGLQDRDEVMLVRHAYTRTDQQGKGLGTRLLAHVRSHTAKPVLIGTWAAATWAIAFYQKHGFRVVSPDEKDRLLKRFWTVPERQIETSVVLADTRWNGQD